MVKSKRIKPYLYEYPEIKLNSRKIQKDKFLKEIFWFDSPVESPHPQNNTAYGYILRNNSKNLLIFIHGLRAKRCDTWGNAGITFIDAGFDVLFLRLPYHGKRAHKNYPLGDFFLQVNPVLQLQNFEQAVLEVKLCIDFFSKDYDEIYIMGTSLGAIVGTIAVALDNRIKKAVFVNLGGDFGKIVWKGAGLGEFRKRHLKEGVTYQKCKRTRSYYDDFLREVKKCKSIDEIWDIEIEGERCYPCKGFNIPSECYYADPLTFLNFVEIPVLLINGIFDLTIQYPCKIKVIESLKDKKVIWLPCEHISTGIFHTILFQKSISFLKD